METRRAVERQTTTMTTLSLKNKTNQRVRCQERAQRRMKRLIQQDEARERARDAALARLVSLLENAHTENVEHLKLGFRSGDGYSRLARLRAAHASYALATMKGLERASEGAFVRA
jgi:hypothetical protein